MPSSETAHPRSPGPVADRPAAPPPVQGSALEVLLAFLALGCTAFGGPVAHLGYFRREFVLRRAWLDDGRYADLVALCQFLPGPASSQVGIALGLGRAGWPGALAAWLGFTLPSAVLLIGLALGLHRWGGAAMAGALHGLQVVAVAIVAQAVWSMSSSLCPDRLRAGVAIAAALLATALPSTLGQVAAIGAGAVAGRWIALPPREPLGATLGGGVSPRVGAALLVVFVLLLVLLPLGARWLHAPALALVAAFYQSGALVLGGGHVVLPLLQAHVVPSGWLSHDAFLAGYGAAQAVPGPLFTFAAYLGAAMAAPLGGWTGGLVLLLAIFAPAFLLVVGALPFWVLLRQRAPVQQAMAGAQAAVVGLLAAALYDPVWTGAIHTRGDFGLALAAFGLLVPGRQSPVVVVALVAVVGAWLGP